VLARPGPICERIGLRGHAFESLPVDTFGFDQLSAPISLMAFFNAATISVPARRFRRGGDWRLLRYSLHPNAGCCAALGEGLPGSHFLRVSS
jgi:hypothetical protein